MVSSPTIKFLSQDRNHSGRTCCNNKSHCTISGGNMPSFDYLAVVSQLILYIIMKIFGLEKHVIIDKKKE